MPKYRHHASHRDHLQDYNPHRFTWIIKKTNPECTLAYPGCTIRATQIDHLIPLAAGGTHTLDNIQPVCHHCHVIKTTLIDTPLIRTHRQNTHPHHKPYPPPTKLPPHATPQD